VGDVVGAVVADQPGGDDGAHGADAAVDVDIAEDAGAERGQACHGVALDSDPATQPAADTEVAKDVAQHDDRAVESAGGHGNAAETGAVCRADADVALDGHDAVQVALEVDEAHQVGRADDLAG